MLSCKEITTLASEGIDKEMPFFRRMQFNMHLLICKNCRQFIEQMETTINTISRLEPIKPSDEVINNQVDQLLKFSQNLKQET